MRKHSDCYSGKLEMEMGSNIDLNLLRRPLTPFTDFQEAKRAFDKGSKEVRHLLLYECGLIYECNVCRNMFRSLANFISHKRVFCCTSSKEHKGTHNATNGTDGIQSPKQQVSDYLYKSDLRQKMQKDEQNELSSHMSNEQNEAVNAEETNNHEEENTNENHKASSVSSDYSKPPEESKNQSMEYVFQCPTCSLTFQKSSTVLRHLATAHNIPIRRICMMRDSLLKCSAKPTDEVVEMSSNVEKNFELSAGLQISECSSSSGEEKKDEIETTSSECFFCRESFECRSSLDAHMQNCVIKTEVLRQNEESTNGEAIKEEQELNNISNDAIDDVADIADNESNQLTIFEAEIDSQSVDVKPIAVYLEDYAYENGMQTVTLDKMEVSPCESTDTSLVVESDMPETDKSETKSDESLAASSSSLTVEDNVSPPSSIKKRHMRPSNAQFCRCKICSKHFNALSNLRRHISMFHYRSRKFGCALCDYCAFRRYDVVNHLNFVHKLDTESDTSAKELVRVNDVQYTKDDMNDDIVLCTYEERIAAENLLNSIEAEGKSNEQAEQASKLVKRQRRRVNKVAVNLESDTKKPSEQLANEIEVESKLTRQKLKRSQSQAEESTMSAKGSQKRPKRNRTKAVNKDFVYDMKGMAKRDASDSANGNPNPECETYQLRGSKRRNTILAQFEQTATVPAFEIIKVKHFDAIKGSARRACLMIVHQGQAASSTPPEIPAERPQMRPRLTSTQRNDSQSGPIIDTTDLESERFKSLPLCDDSYLEKIAKESVGSFKIKPCLEHFQQHSSALDSLLQKVDSSKHLNGSARNVSNPISCVQSLNLKDTHFDSTLLETGCNNNIPSYLTTPEQAIPKTLSTPIRPQKRLSSLDRLSVTINSLEIFYNAQLKN